MKESEIKRMSLDEINKRMGMSARATELAAIIETDDKEFFENFMRSAGRARKSDDIYTLIKKQINGDERKINKLALIIITLNSYLRNYDRIIDEIKRNPNGIDLFKEYVAEAKSILKDIDKTIYILNFAPEGDCFVECINSQELVTGKKRETNKSKLKELEENELYLAEILNSIVLTDLGRVICDRQFGEHIRYQAFYNTALEKGLVKMEDDISIDSEEQINTLRDKLDFIEILPEAEKAIRDGIEYIDLDKLLLCSAYRYIEFLDSKTSLAQDAEEELHRRLKIIQEYLKEKNVKIQGKIEKQIFEGDQVTHKYIDISYRARDFEKDMEKYVGTTYWGKAKVEDVKAKLLLGQILYKDLEYKGFKLNTEEIISVATISDDNYLYLIENGIINDGIIQKINDARGSLPIECLHALMAGQSLTIEDVIELYLQGKVSIGAVTELEIDLNDKVKVEDIYLEFSREDNENRQKRAAELYRKMMLEKTTDEEIEEHKQIIYDAYLSSLDARYLEIFLNLGTLSFSDLDGIMTGKEWMEALNRGEITEEFFFKLQQNGIINAQDIKADRKMLLNELKLWEDGIVNSEQIKQLGITFEELLKLCDKGIITGKRIHELMQSVEERDSARRKIRSNYAYGILDTIKPGLACYNNDLMNRDGIVTLIKDMKVKEQELVDACMQGILSGAKIAELHYQHLISKQVFSKIKEAGLVTDEDEISVLNNLTPEEMISELQENGCEQIKNIEEIIRESTIATGITRKKGETQFGYRKQIINPLARNKLLELLGADKIVTTPEQGFKGYQVYLIPQLNIAVMEKMFRLDKDKNAKPAYGDATYICELGKFLMVAGQSKQEIRAFMNVEGSSNGKVEIIEHRKNWGNKLLEAIAKVNSKLSIQRGKDKNIQQIVNDGKEINVDIQKINDLVQQIRQGDFSLDLEEYE